jgi:type I restriction enzyme S subunit
MKEKIKKGYKPSSLGPIPNDWEVKKINEIAEVKGGFAFDSSKFRESGKYQVVKMSNLYDNNLDLNRSRSFLSAISIQQQESLLEKGDIIITLTGTVGKKDYGYSYQISNEKNLLLNQRVAKIKATKCNDRYLCYGIKTSKFLNQFFFSARGGTGNQANVGTNDLGAIKIFSPPSKEQAAIANILTTWDKAINTLAQLIAQKELRKKWLMQQLLTGKKRLKGFKGEWRESEIREIFDFISTSSFSRDCLTDNKLEGDVYCIHYGNIHAVYESDILDANNESRIPILKKEYNENISELLKDGDLIIADASEDYEGVGESVELINIGKKKIIGGLHTIVLRDKRKGITSKGFKGHFFNHSVLLNALRRIATGTSVYSVSKSALSLIRIKRPSIEEQHAITFVLDQADKEIEIQRNKLSQLKEQKKGLMQILLTGRKRLVKRTK